ncbi:MAG: adenosine deaminase [Treponema sp.]|nr:MAG: adenosine deaminase [Treponema sp.]
MKDKEYYLSQPKADLHAHLNLSMRYANYKKWAGFSIPDFPRVMDGLGEMHKIIADYTRPRTKTAQDVKDLFKMSFDAAIKDNVVKFEASIDIGFIRHFNNDLDSFLEYIDGLVKKYADKMEFLPELGIPKTLDRKFIKKWCKPMMESRVFKILDLYGPEVFNDLEDFVFIFEMADKYNIKKKAHVGEFSSAESVKKLVEMYTLDEVQHGIGAVNDKKILNFLAKRKIRCNVCPQSNYMLGAVKSLKEHPIKKMMDAGVPVALGTDDILFFNKSNGEQIYDLLQENIITEDDAEKLLKMR